ncbi:hypothetical protein A2Z33_00690 [Candidatus Gottesmanbacteria bacterium RBG_16_52_11]|uniref:Uncharacterized protein n=1 Tax=Candidatus Gottesmanbacteria bacterium RBG_16_52_11 TaxID=1798374 RepID=A0A1F5YN64_9BACT|nr:MAG: hypothetical protein A2Z33_00690 [Candidatus Gottesmanbacteria bacterium RBG_16_52_11]
MPPKQRVVVFNDNPLIRNAIIDDVTLEGHTVAGIASDLEGLKNELRRLDGSELDSLLFLVDNSAPRESGGVTGDVGPEAAVMILTYFPEARVVAVSTSREKLGFGEAHWRPGEDPIGENITALPPRKESR